MLLGWVARSPFTRRSSATSDCANALGEIPMVSRNRGPTKPYAQDARSKNSATRPPNPPHASSDVKITWQRAALAERNWSPNVSAWRTHASRQSALSFRIAASEAPIRQWVKKARKVVEGSCAAVPTHSSVAGRASQVRLKSNSDSRSARVPSVKSSMASFDRLCRFLYAALTAKRARPSGQASSLDAGSSSGNSDFRAFFAPPLLDPGLFALASLRARFSTSVPMLATDSSPRRDRGSPRSAARPPGVLLANSCEVDTPRDSAASASQVRPIIIECREPFSFTQPQTARQKMAEVLAVSSSLFVARTASRTSLASARSTDWMKRRAAEDAAAMSAAAAHSRAVDCRPEHALSARRARDVARLPPPQASAS